MSKGWHFHKVKKSSNSLGDFLIVFEMGEIDKPSSNF